MRCQTEACIRSVETAAWKRLRERDLTTARILGRDVLSKDVWQLILNERQKKLCNNLDKPTNKYLLEAFAIDVGADENSVKKMTKAQLCGLISRNIGRSTAAAESEIVSAKKEIEKKTKEIKILARKFNIDTDQPIKKILADISKRL